MKKPSEKAMQLAQKLTYTGCFHHKHYVGDEQAAAEIDTHTADAVAEATAERDRVIQMAEKALSRMMDCAKERWIDACFDEMLTQSKSALAELATLRKE